MGLWKRIRSTLASIMSSEESLTHILQPSNSDGAFLLPNFCDLVLDDAQDTRRIDKLASFLIDEAMILKGDITEGQHEVFMAHVSSEIVRSHQWLTMERRGELDKEVPSPPVEKPTRPLALISDSSSSSGSSDSLNKFYKAVDYVRIHKTREEAIAAVGGADYTTVVTDIYTRTPVAFPAPLAQPTSEPTLQHATSPSTSPSLLHLALVGSSFLKASPDYNVKVANCYHLAGSLLLILREAFHPAESLPTSEFLRKQGSYSMFPFDMKLDKIKAQYPATIRKSYFGEIAAKNTREAAIAQVQAAHRSENRERVRREEAEQVARKAEQAAREAEQAAREAVHKAEIQERARREKAEEAVHNAEQAVREAEQAAHEERTHREGLEKEIARLTEALRLKSL